MESIEHNNRVVIPRIIREYESPYFRRFEEELLRTQNTAEYNAIIKTNQKPQCEVVLEALTESAIDKTPNDKQLHGVYTWMLPADCRNDIHVRNAPHRRFEWNGVHLSLWKRYATKLKLTFSNLSVSETEREK